MSETTMSETTMSETSNIRYFSTAEFANIVKRKFIERDARNLARIKRAYANDLAKFKRDLLNTAYKIDKSKIKKCRDIMTASDKEYCERYRINICEDIINIIKNISEIQPLNRLIIYKPNDFIKILDYVHPCYYEDDYLFLKLRFDILHIIMVVDLLMRYYNNRRPNFFEGWDISDRDSILNILAPLKDIFMNTFLTLISKFTNIISRTVINCVKNMPSIKELKKSNPYIPEHAELFGLRYWYGILSILLAVIDYQVISFNIFHAIDIQHKYIKNIDIIYAEFNELFETYFKLYKTDDKVKNDFINIAKYGIYNIVTDIDFKPKGDTKIKKSRKSKSKKSKRISEFVDNDSSEKHQKINETLDTKLSSVSASKSEDEIKTVRGFNIEKIVIDDFILYPNYRLIVKTSGESLTDDTFNNWSYTSYYVKNNKNMYMDVIIDTCCHDICNQCILNKFYIIQDRFLSENKIICANIIECILTSDYKYDHGFDCLCEDCRIFSIPIEFVVWLKKAIAGLPRYWLYDEFKNHFDDYTIYGHTFAEYCVRIVNILINT